MFGFGFRKVETVSLAEALAAKGEDALRLTLGLLSLTADDGVARAEVERAIRSAVASRPEYVLNLLVSLPELLWKELLAALEKGPRTLAAPSDLPKELHRGFFDHLNKFYSNVFFAHVFPERGESGELRIAVVEEVRTAWKNNRRGCLRRRAALERLCRLAQGAVNLYGCIDVERFVACVGDVGFEDVGIDMSLQIVAMFEDGSQDFCCKDGEIFHRALASDASAHTRIRRAHVGKTPRPATVEELLAAADEDRVQQSNVFRRALAEFEKSLPKALLSEATEIVAGFEQGCRRGDDVAATMGQFAALLSISGEEGSLDCAALTPLYNATPLWEEFGYSREKVGKAAPFQMTDGAGGRTQVNEGAQVGRNDPCPCGSGKKFKKCCGRGL